MAHSKSALKRWRQNEAHRERNKSVRTRARTAVKKARSLADAGPSDEAQEAIREASSILDRAAKGNVVHPNAVARHKSRLMRHLNKAADGTATVDAPKKKKATAKGKATAAKPKAKAKAAAAKPTAKVSTAKPKAKVAAAKPGATKAKPAAKA